MSPGNLRAALAAAGLAVATAVGAAERRAVTPADTYSLKVPSAIEVSPDGGTVVFVVETQSRQGDQGVHTLYSMPVKGGEPRPLIDGASGASRPRFSPDGRRLAFLADGGGEAQLVVGDARGGHRKTLTRGTAVESFDWSPDGREIVFARHDAQGTQADNDPWVITRTQIQRDGEGFLTSRRDHLWIVAVGGGEARQLTTGAYDESDPRWSPDGKWIAFVSNRTADPDTNDNTDVFVVAPDGKDLHAVAANPGPDDTPRWSHGSDRIAFVGGKRANDFYQTRPLMVTSVRGASVVDLTGPLDTWVAADDPEAGGRGGGIWSRDDQTLYVTLERRGATYVTAVPSTGGPGQEVLGGPRQIGNVRLSPRQDRFFLTVGDPTHLPEIHAMAPDGSGLERLTHLNDAFLASVALSVPEKLVARNGAGDEVDSWLYPPLHLDPARKYPLILYIHGGPQEFDGEFFDPGLENQVFPGAGYAVLRVNYRGTTSYGEKFCRALWGTGTRASTRT